MNLKKAILDALALYLGNLKNTFALKSHSHAWSGITGKPSTFTPSTHNHTKSQITDFPTSLRNPQALTLQINGTTKVTYTGATAGSLNITPDAIGAAKTSHGTHVAFSTATPLMDGTASVGSNTSVARSDHRHPTDTSRAPASHTHAWSQVTGKPSTFAPSSHTHDDRYLTEAETTSKLNSKADNLTITATTLYAFVNAIIATDTFSCSGRFDTNGGTWAPAGDGWYKFWATFLNHDAATYEPSIQVILGRGEAFYVGYIAGKGGSYTCKWRTMCLATQGDIGVTTLGSAVNGIKFYYYKKGNVLTAFITGNLTVDIAAWGRFKSTAALPSACRPPVNCYGPTTSGGDFNFMVGGDGYIHVIRTSSTKGGKGNFVEGSTSYGVNF